MSFRKIREVAFGFRPFVRYLIYSRPLRISIICCLNNIIILFPYTKNGINSLITFYIDLTTIRLVAFVYFNNFPVRHVRKITYHPHPIFGNGIQHGPYLNIRISRLKDGINLFPGPKNIIYGYQTFYLHFSFFSSVTFKNVSYVSFCHVRKVTNHSNPILWN